ncbi:MAG: hypothetical protein PHU77_07750 [Simplicispira sp.]|nr:hypothetical protein [Simplicispira sp.]
MQAQLHRCQHIAKRHAAAQQGACAQRVHGRCALYRFGQQQAAFFQRLAQRRHIQAAGGVGVGAGLVQGAVQGRRGLVQQVGGVQGGVGGIELATRKDVHARHVGGLGMAAQEQHLQVGVGVAQQHHGGAGAGSFRGGVLGRLHGGFQKGRV